MAGRDIPGIKGFFDDYGKKPSPPYTKPVSVEEPVATAVEKTHRPRRQAVGEKVRARIGRPPGLRNGDRSEKAKATMHISESLLNFYRDWSWEARCNLGELIERAMVVYKEARRDAVRRAEANAGPPRRRAISGVSAQQSGDRLPP